MMFYKYLYIGILIICKINKSIWYIKLFLYFDVYMKKGKIIIIKWNLWIGKIIVYVYVFI